MKEIDLRQPSWSYFLGLMQGDGHLSSDKGKGKLKIEVHTRDSDLMALLDDITGLEGRRSVRERTTNFGEMTAVSWCVNTLAFREAMSKIGVPVGCKSQMVEVPSVEFCAPDFWRGWIDADGSLGMSSDGIPFISLCTNSESIAFGFIDFLQPIIGEKKHTSRNRRDGVFNIVVMREKAQAVVKALYYPESLSLTRKRTSADQILTWKRPIDMRITGTQKRWTDDEDRMVMTLPGKECVEILGRSLKSIQARSWRLRNNKIKQNCQDSGLRP